MGYGLVAIPKHLWKAGDVKLHQQLLCRQAGIQASLTLKAHRSDASLHFPLGWCFGCTQLRTHFTNLKSI